MPHPARGILDELHVFIGQTSAALAHVYARVRTNVDVSELHLAGSVRGPRSRFTQTLEGKASFMDSGPGDSMLAQALITEPCCWSPEMPFVYLARVELRRDEEVVQRVERMFGIRPFGMRDGQLYLDGKPFDLKAIRADAPAKESLSAWRETGYSLVLESPADDLLQEATLAGIPIVAKLIGHPQDVLRELARVCRWPAVLAVILEDDPQFPPDLRRDAPNTLLVQELPVGEQTAPAGWAQAISLTGTPTAVAAAAQTHALPVLLAALPVSRLAGKLPELPQIEPQLSAWHQSVSQVANAIGWIV